MYTLIVFLVTSIVLILLLRHIPVNIIRPSYKPELAINTPLIIEKKKEQSKIEYPKNDLIQLIITNPRQNIEFKTSYLGDSCKSSKECPDGLSCVSDGNNQYCAKEIPIIQCQSKTCKVQSTQSIHTLGQTCGAIPNSIIPDICDESISLKCMSNDFRNNFAGRCTRIIN